MYVYSVDGLIKSLKAATTTCTDESVEKKKKKPMEGGVARARTRTSIKESDIHVK